ncbi:MAG: anthranilate phosphoribosyltransferase [Alphaproteobacteria bacterium]|nr:anthranilate phosphoribosyltransferase [Alphaproteobacteria bacterium]
MSDTLKSLLKRMTEGEALPRADMETCFDEILEGNATPAQMAAFVTALKMKGETPDDIAAGASVLRARAVRISASDAAMDIVGTGGDGIGTWNISSATAFVVAGAGVSVAKHGNRAVSSKSGAADVLLSLGINLDADMALVQAALERANVCFLMAPRHHSAMRHVGPVRAELGYRTIFNMLGPLSNPAMVKRIMVGVFDKKWLHPFAQALHDLGTTHALVVHGRDGLDEVTTTTATDAVLLRDGTMTEMVISPEDIGLPIADPKDLIGGTPDDNAAALSALMDGATGAYRDIVVLNAAAALYGAGHADSLTQGAEMATQSLDSGAARDALDKLVALTNSAIDHNGKN